MYHWIQFYLPKIDVFFRINDSSKSSDLRGIMVVKYFLKDFEQLPARNFFLLLYHRFTPGFLIIWGKCLASNLNSLVIALQLKFYSPLPSVLETLSSFRFVILIWGLISSLSITLNILRFVIIWNRWSEPSFSSRTAIVRNYTFVVLEPFQSRVFTRMFLEPAEKHRACF